MGTPVVGTPVLDGGAIGVPGTPTARVAVAAVSPAVSATGTPSVGMAHGVRSFGAHELEGMSEQVRDHVTVM